MAARRAVLLAILAGRRSLRWVAVARAVSTQDSIAEACMQLALAEVLAAGNTVMRT